MARDDHDNTPATIEQIAAAMAALGMYHGTNTPAEHAQEAARLGGVEAYRVRMVNALLGIVQTEAMLADAADIDQDAKFAAWEQQLDSAGAGDDPVRRLEFLRWQVLRAGTPLRLIAQNVEVGPIPVAAAHAASGLQVLLGVIAASQDAITRGDVETLSAQAAAIREARGSLKSAIDNADILLEMLGSVGL